MQIAKQRMWKTIDKLQEGFGFKATNNVGRKREPLSLIEARQFPSKVAVLEVEEVVEDVGNDS